MEAGPARFTSLVAFALWLGACGRPQPSVPSKAERDQVAIVRGQSVYDTICAPCHDVENLHLVKDPPKLDGLFSKPKLPSGGPATDENVRDVILHGRGIMPPFEHSLTSQNVDDLLKYLHTR